MEHTCFVIMPIGAQRYGPVEITARELRERYTDLIREAILRARPNLNIVRADDIAAPGGITTDIFAHLMRSSYVIADVTFPNPNVFYELGLRHACKSATVLIRERRSEPIPFDFVDLRHIEYENTPTGLKALTDKLREYFDWIEMNPGKPDNRFMELAISTGYEFPTVSNAKRLARLRETLADAVAKATEETQPDEDASAVLMRTFETNPKVYGAMLESMILSGELFSGFSQTQRFDASTTKK